MLKPEIEKLLKIVVMNFMNIEYIRTLDTIMIVSPQNIQYHVPLTDIYIGVNATTSITNLKNNSSVDSNEVIKFFKSCQEFYIELVVDIKKRFVFDDPVFKCIAVTDPALIKQFSVKSLNHVIERFPVLNSLISSPQELDMEWRELALMDIEPINNNSSNDIMMYWRKVFLLKNSIGDIYFPNICITMRLLLILPVSNASVERLFSDLKNIKTLHRNKLQTQSIIGILRTKNSITDCVSFKPTDAMIKSKIWDMP